MVLATGQERQDQKELIELREKVFRQKERALNDLKNFHIEVRRHFKLN